MKRILKIILKILKIIGIALLSIIILLSIIRFVLKIAIKQNSINNNEISEMIELNLNGYSQKVLLEGKSNDLPLLVILHGGPGLPIPFGNAYRGAYPKLTNNYIVIEWDQYGCGNNSANYNNLSTSDYVKMTKDLISYLKEKYPNNKLYLFGLSWGTIIGSYIANEMPNDIEKYISYGTFTNMRITYDYIANMLLNSDINENDKTKIKEYKNNYSFENLLEMQKIGIKNNISFQGTDKMDNMIYNSMIRLLVSPDYNIIDIFKTFTNNVYETKIYNEIIYDIDTTNNYKTIQIPTYIIQGKYDEQTPHYYMKDIVENNDNIQYLELEESGHLPTTNDFDKIIDYIISLKQQ